MMKANQMHEVGSAAMRNASSASGQSVRRPRSSAEQFRLRWLYLTCPSCGEIQRLDADSPRQIFDPELHRFACPSCLEVIRLLPYPLFKLGEPADLAAAHDWVSHSSCAAVGAYDGANDPAGADRQTVAATYLYLRLPDQAIC